MIRKVSKFELVPWRTRGVTPEQIDAKIRWKKAEQAGTSKPSEKMIEHYTDVRLALDYLLKYSEAL